jgi:hypothetical protein
VTLFKDKDLSGANNSMPLKPSLNRANALKMFEPSTWSWQDRVWKDMLRSENNQNQGSKSGPTICRVLWRGACHSLCARTCEACSVVFGSVLQLGSLELRGDGKDT